jgi:hypothetical protein
MRKRPVSRLELLLIRQSTSRFNSGPLDKEKQWQRKINQQRTVIQTMERTFLAILIHTRMRLVKNFIPNLCYATKMTPRHRNSRVGSEKSRGLQRE